MTEENNTTVVFQYASSSCTLQIVYRQGRLYVPTFYQEIGARVFLLYRYVVEPEPQTNQNWHFVLAYSRIPTYSRQCCHI